MVQSLKSFKQEDAKVILITVQDHWGTSVPEMHVLTAPVTNDNIAQRLSVKAAPWLLVLVLVGADCK